MTQSLLEAAAMLKQFSTDRRSWTADLNARVDAVSRDLAVSNAPQLASGGKNASAVEQEMVEALLVMQKNVNYGIRALQDCKLLIVDAAASNPLQRLENVVLGAQSGDSVILRPGVYTTPISVRNDNIVIKGGSGGQVVMRTAEPVSFVTMQARGVSVKSVAVEQLGKIGSALVCVPSAADRRLALPSAADSTTPGIHRTPSLRPAPSFRSSGRWQPHAGTIVYEDCSFFSAGAAAVLISGGSYRFERCTFSAPSNVGLRVRQQQASRSSTATYRSASSDDEKGSPPGSPKGSDCGNASRIPVELCLLNCRFTNCRDGCLFISGDEQVSVRISRCSFDATEGSGVHLGALCAASIEVIDTTFVSFGVAGVMAEKGNQVMLSTTKCRFVAANGEAAPANACIVGVANAQRGDEAAAAAAEQ